MSDRKLLELAALAAGIDAEYHTELGDEDGLYLKGKRGPSNSKYWNPLTDDGDALRLAVKLELDVDTTQFVACVYGPRVAVDIDCDASDKFAATRRAIVRAAAEIGRSMK